MNKKTPKMWLLPLAAVVWNQTVYYGGNLLAHNAPHRNLELPVDRLIPFLPWTVVIYLGCFLFWAALYLRFAGRDKPSAYRFFCADFLAKGVCLVCFLLLPTTNLRPVVQDAGVWERLMLFVYRMDAPTNLFPSIHCLVSWLCFIGARSDRRFSPRAVWLTGLTAAAICLSTLTTRQHVAVDVAGGILLAECAYWAAGHKEILEPFSRLADRLTGQCDPETGRRGRRA